MTEILYILIYQPLFNLLIFFYNLSPFFDVGIAVILMTVVIKFLLYPLGMKSVRSQKEMEDIQPEIKKIQEKYKDDKEKQAKKLMEFYKEKKINPFAGLLPLFIQLPILISLFQIFRRGLENEEMKHLYSFISSPVSVDYTFLGVINLSEANVFLAILAGCGQYFQMKMMSNKKNKEAGNDMAKAIQSQMIYFLPGFTFIILLSLPSVVGLYWIITVGFSVFQQYIVKKEKININKENGGNKKNN